MTKDEHNTLQQLRYMLRKTGYFAFEKAGKFFLYREADVAGERNSLVLSNTDIHGFYEKSRKAAGV